MNKLAAKYFDYRNKCSIKLSKCGNYLISGDFIFSLKTFFISNFNSYLIYKIIQSLQRRKCKHMESENN